MLNSLPVAILAGGLATRLKPLTEWIPKALVEVAGRPFVDWQLEWLAACGVRRVVFCLGHLGEIVEAHVGDGAGFAAIMHEHWLGKRARSAGMSNERINEWYDLAMENGALGGKLIGAGGGGFLMFYAKDRARLRKAMRGAGLQEVRFQFDFEGTKIVG